MRGRRVRTEAGTGESAGAGFVARWKRVLGLAGLLCLSLVAAASGAHVSGWSFQRSANPTRDTGLAAVSCVSVSVCTAVGGTYGPDSTPLRAVVERYNGRSWTVQPAPSPSRGVLVAVSCVSTSACIAVGAVWTHPFRSRTLAERWNGRRWKVVSTPGPPGGSLTDVSCASPKVCIAVGDASTSSDPLLTRSLAERWNGRRWKVEPTRTDDILDSVSCISANDCIAVGYHRGGAHTLAERWNGRRWKLQSTPNPPTVSAYKSPAYAALNAVSCSSASACMAVGGYSPAQYSADPLAERWNGRKWTITSTPDATGRGAPSGVSCATTNACTAVGMLDNRGERDGAERWNGSTWTIQSTPSTYDGTLADVSCPTNSRCIAVGGNQTKNPAVITTLAERWNH